MSYGANSSLVEEVIELAERGPLLRPQGVIAGERVRVVRDFAEATEFAHRRFISDDEDAMNWTDLRELQARNISQAPDEIWTRLAEIVPGRVPPAYAAVMDDVIADLANIASSRGVSGAGDSLWDRMWEAYRQGGWPCGWEGNYPAGVLVVFQPA